MKIKMFFLIECSIILGGIFIYSVFGYKDTDNVIKTVRINNNSNNSSIESNVIITKDDIYIPMKDLSNVLGKGMMFDKEKNLIRIPRGDQLDLSDTFYENKELFYEAIKLFKKYQQYELKTNHITIYCNESLNNIDEHVSQKEVKDIIVKLNSICNVTGIKFKQCTEESSYIEFLFDEEVLRDAIIYSTDYINTEDELLRKVYNKIESEEAWYTAFFPYV